MRFISTSPCQGWDASKWESFVADSEKIVRSHMGNFFIPKSLTIPCHSNDCVRADRRKLQRFRRCGNYARPARRAMQSRSISTKRTSHRAPQNVGLRGQFRKSWIVIGRRKLHKEKGRKVLISALVS